MVRFKGCRRLLPRGVTLRLKLKVTWSSHIITVQCRALRCTNTNLNSIHQVPFLSVPLDYVYCTFMNTLLVVGKTECRVCPPDVRKCDSTLLSSANINTLLFGRFLFVLLEEQHVDEDKCGTLIE